MVFQGPLGQDDDGAGQMWSNIGLKLVINVVNCGQTAVTRRSNKWGRGDWAKKANGTNSGQTVVNSGQTVDKQRTGRERQTAQKSIPKVVKQWSNSGQTEDWARKASGTTPTPG
jgi:hypothetical protein